MLDYQISFFKLGYFYASFENLFGWAAQDNVLKTSISLF